MYLANIVVNISITYAKYWRLTIGYKQSIDLKCFI
jgi:hypothetical protein